MTDEKIQHEVDDLIRDHLDRDNVGKFKTELVALCKRVRDAERERCAGIAEHIDHIACTQYMDSEATGKEVARCIRNAAAG